MSSYYLQKNFSGTYVRAGKQNSVDYASGSVSTVLTPSFDRFVTIGSQDNLRSQRNAGSLVLYATAEGNYEFYRNGRLVWKRPATLAATRSATWTCPAATTRWKSGWSIATAM